MQELGELIDNYKFKEAAEGERGKHVQHMVPLWSPTGSPLRNVCTCSPGSVPL